MLTKTHFTVCEMLYARKYLLQIILFNSRHRSQKEKLAEIKICNVSLVLNRAIVSVFNEACAAPSGLWTQGPPTSFFPRPSLVDGAEAI